MGVVITLNWLLSKTDKHGVQYIFLNLINVGQPEVLVIYDHQLR